MHMGETLKRLLDAEKKAQERVREGREERDRLIEQAHQEAREAEERLERRISELRQSYLQEAEEQAKREIAELKADYQQRIEELTESARRNRDAAVQRAADWLLDPGNP